MTDAEKLAFCQSMIPPGSPPLSEDIISAYLSAAQSRIADRLYPFGSGGTVPERYDELQCELAVRMLARRGADGEVSHSENGISRAYASADDIDLLSRIVPYVGVV